MNTSMLNTRGCRCSPGKIDAKRLIEIQNRYSLLLFVNNWEKAVPTFSSRFPSHQLIIVNFTR